MPKSDRSNRNRNRARANNAGNQFSIRNVAIRSSPPRIARVTRLIDKSFVTSTSAANGFYSFIFLLSDVADSSSLTSVYDQYRFDRVDFYIYPVSQPQLPGSTASWSVLYAAVDFDDASTPGSVAEVSSYANAIALPPGRGKNFSFKPRFIMGSYNGAVTANTLSRPGTFIDCAFPSVEHYAVKIAVTQSTSTNVNTWYVICRYHLTFASSR